MGTLEEQLKKWQRGAPKRTEQKRAPGAGSSSGSSSGSASGFASGFSSGAAPATSGVSPSTSTSGATRPAGSGDDRAPARRRATKKDPFPAFTMRRDEQTSMTPTAPKETPPPPPTDAELFSRAVQAVDDDVVLRKFDATEVRPAPRAPGHRGQPPTDEELFLSFVGDVRKAATSPAPGPSMSSSASSSARLSLRGTPRASARRRLEAFLGDAVRAGADVVVVEVDDDSAGAVDDLREHALVKSVRTAGPAQGGKNARILQLRR
jgi:hypothetical protein